MNDPLMLEPSVALRAVERRDLAELVCLCREHAAYERSEWVDRDQEGDLAALFLASDTTWCWVIQAEHELSGFVSASLEVSTWDAKRFLHMDCLFLRPAYRGRGWGRRIMARVAQLALDQKAINLQWQTPEWNEGAIRFYDRLGGVSQRKQRFTMSPEACGELVDGQAGRPAAPGESRSQAFPAADRWEPREVRFLGVESMSEWQVKCYGIALKQDHQQAWGASQQLVAEELSFVSEPHAGLAIAILHRGSDAWWLVLDAWLEGAMLAHQVFRSEHQNPGVWLRGSPRGPSFCVWELAVLGFERDAYVKSVFAGDPPDVEHYLSVFMNGEC